MSVVESIMDVGKGMSMSWTVEVTDGAVTFTAPGQWSATTPETRHRIRARLRAAEFISAVPLCPEYSTAEPVSAEALAAALVVEYGDVNLPAELAERVVPSIPSGAVP